MPRTTLNIDAPILDELRRLQEKVGKPLGKLVSDLLAGALAKSGAKTSRPPTFRWRSQRMGALVDLEDKEGRPRPLGQA